MLANQVLIVSSGVRQCLCVSVCPSVLNDRCYLLRSPCEPDLHCIVCDIEAIAAELSVGEAGEPGFPQRLHDAQRVPLPLRGCHRLRRSHRTTLPRRLRPDGGAHQPQVQAQGPAVHHHVQQHVLLSVVSTGHQTAAIHALSQVPTTRSAHWGSSV